MFLQGRRSSSKSWDMLVQEMNAMNLDLDFLQSKTPLDLESTDLNKSVAHAYEIMQRYAIGIEQVTLDQALYESHSLEEFRKIEKDIVMNLCEFNFVMLKKKIEPVENVPKSIMGEQTRNMGSNTGREYRDTYILKAYIDGVNDMYKLFQNLLKVLSAQENRE